MLMQVHAVFRCFLLVTRSKGMQVMTYEGQQVCVIKFQGDLPENKGACAASSAVYSAVCYLTGRVKCKHG